MVEASLNGIIIARSDATIVIEGNHYFPLSSVDDTTLQVSDMTSRCPWKGLASYYDVIVGGERQENVAWTYPAPNDAAQEIKDYVAFSQPIKVTEL